MTQIPQDIEDAYRAWRQAADVSFRSASRQTTPAAEKRKQERINRLRLRYEAMLRAWKAETA